MSLYAIGRSGATRRWIGALAVLVLALRALVPTGFMLAQAGGHLTVVVCPAAAPTLTMAGMHHHAGAHAAHHLAAAASCPFALSGGAMLVSQALTTPDPYYVGLQPVPAPTVVSHPAAPPPRHQAPRGPPVPV